LYMQAVAKTECFWGAYDQALSKVFDSSRDPAQRRDNVKVTVFPARESLVEQVGTMLSYLQNAICSTGTMGTVMNIEQHSIPYILDNPGNDLAALMGYIGCYVDTENRDLDGYNTTDGSMTPGQCLSICKEKNFKYYAVQYGSYCFCGNSYGKYGFVSYTECNMSCNGDKTQDCGGTWRNSIYAVSNSLLPASLMPSLKYSGNPRLIVPTARTDVQSTETFTQRVMILSAVAPSSVQFNFRPMGSNIPWNTVVMRPVASDRQVYYVSLPVSRLKVDFEYYIKANVNGTNLYFPETYPTTPFTVLVI